MIIRTCFNHWMVSFFFPCIIAKWRCMLLTSKCPRILKMTARSPRINGDKIRKPHSTAACWQSFTHQPLLLSCLPYIFAAVTTPFSTCPHFWVLLGNEGWCKTDVSGGGFLVMPRSLSVLMVILVEMWLSFQIELNLFRTAEKDIDEFES